MPSDYKCAWCERYAELARELFGCEAEDCTPQQCRELNVAIRDWELDWLGSQADAAEARGEER